ncbi:MAG: vitamin B12 transporter [Flavobacteriales bacterium]
MIRSLFKFVSLPLPLPLPLLKALTVTALGLCVHSQAILADEGLDDVVGGEVRVESVLVQGARLHGAQAALTQVISEETIRQQNSASVSDILRNAVGINLVQAGGPGGITELFIRGAESNFSVVTIDGIRVNDTTNSRGGGFDLASINPDTIAQIDIMRGPLSSSLGSDALAGAINIVTRSPDSSETLRVRVEEGSDDYHRRYLGLSLGAKKGLAASLNVAQLDSGEAVEGSRSDLNSIDGQIDYQADNGLRIDSNFRFIERQRQSYPSAGGGPRLSILSDLETADANEKSAAIRLRHRLSNSLDLDVQLSHFTRDEHVNTPSVIAILAEASRPSSISDSQLNRNNINAFVRYQASAAIDIAAGLEVERERGESDGELDLGFAILPSGFDLSRDTQAAFSELNIALPASIELFASTRFDSIKNADSQNSSKLALAWQSKEGSSRVGANWGSAFKMPSFYALGDSLVGNDALKPETSQTAELYFKQISSTKMYELNLSGFSSEFKNLIDFDFATFKMRNVDKVSVTGVELETLAHWSEYTESGFHVSYSDYDVEGGEELDGRAAWNAGIYSQWQVRDFSARMHILYVGERSSQSVVTGARSLDAYQRLDFAFSKDLNEMLELSLNIDNALDTSYEEEIGFPSAGRMIRMGLSMAY